MKKDIGIKSLKSGNNIVESSLAISFETQNTTIEYSCPALNLYFEKADLFAFNALKLVREELEKESIFLMCKGNRKDVYPSGGQMTGSTALLLKLGIRVSIFNDKVNIFDKEEDGSTLGTIQEQHSFYKLWLDSIKNVEY